MGKSSHAKWKFHNVEEVNGTEVYGRRMAPTSSTSILRRSALRDKVQNPKQATTTAVIMNCVDAWEVDVLAYDKAGGRELDPDV